jgi:DNA replication protein DnaC
MTIEAMLKQLKLPTIQRNYQVLCETAVKNNWSFPEYLSNLLELETEERKQGRIGRYFRQSCLPEGKTLATLNWKHFSEKVRRQSQGLLDGGFVKRAENVLAFGLPGRGKTHLLAAIGHELVLKHGYQVFFTSVFSLVQQLLSAKANLRMEEMLKKLDRYDAVILDDIGYVQQSREEMEVLFIFMSERYERRSLMITSNLIFGQWDKIFKDPMTTSAAIDRLVHHSIILEMLGPTIRIPKEEGESKKQDQKL